MTAPTPHGVVISIDDVYKQLLVVSAQVNTLTVAVNQITDHEVRLRQLERGKWPLPALMALIALGSLVVAAVAVTLK